MHITIFALFLILVVSLISVFLLRKILSFIKGRLHSVGDRDIDCPCCLLTFKHQITALYIKVFQKIRDLKLDSHMCQLCLIILLHSYHVRLPNFLQLSLQSIYFVVMKTSIKHYSHQVIVVIHTFSTLNAFLSTFQQSESNSVNMSIFGQV